MWNNFRIFGNNFRIFYTFSDESGRNYYTGRTEPEAPAVTDEEAAAIRAKYMGAMGL